MMRIVVKIGTSSVTDEHGAINNHAIETLCDQVAQLREQSHEVLVVTSGAVAGGVAALGMSQRPTDTQTLQALAAVGQSQLMNRYNEYLSARGLIGAQVLLVPNDFIDRTQYLHARQSLMKTTQLPATKFASATMTALLHSLRTVLAQMRWYCSPTLVACTQQTHAPMLRQHLLSKLAQTTHCCR
jgi:aspartokinase